MKLRTIFTAAVAAGALLMMQGCTNPTEYVLENIDAGAQCSQVFNGAGIAAQNAAELAEMLSATPYAKKLQEQLAGDKMTSCVAAMNGSSYLYDAGKQLLVMDHSANVAEVALDQIYQSAYMQAKIADHWSEKLAPKEFMIWANALDASFKTDFIAGLYETYGLYSDMWSELKDSRLGEQAHLYEQQALISGDLAKKSVFTSLVSDYMHSEQRTAEYAKWYARHLEPREEPVMSFCLTMDGGLDPCLSSETVYPDADTGKSALSADHLMSLSKAPDGTSWLGLEEAGDILERARQVDAGPVVAKTLAELHTKLEYCCDGSSDGGGFGIGMRGFGLAF
jgi:hypothetical protein